jgi:hypothetical protein
VAHFCSMRAKRQMARAMIQVTTNPESEAPNSHEASSADDKGCRTDAAAMDPPGSYALLRQWHPNQ